MSWLISRAMMEQCGSLRCSPEPVAASSADICLDGAPSAPSNTTATPQAYLWRDKTTDAWRRFPSGMTCGHLTADRGEELLTSFRAAFPAKTFPQQDEEQESKANEADYGAKWPGSLARYDPSSRSWKTRQCLLLGDLAEYAETWPSWGMTRGGELFRRPMPERLTKEQGYGLWHPTPCKDDYKGATFEAMKKKGESYLKYWLHARFPVASTTYPHPQLSEAVLGWPIGWTDLSPLAMDSARKRRR